MESHLDNSDGNIEDKGLDQCMMMEMINLIGKLKVGMNKVKTIEAKEDVLKTEGMKNGTKINEEIEKRLCEMETKFVEKNHEFEEMKTEINELRKENGELKERMAKWMKALEELKMENVELKEQFVMKIAELDGQIGGLKEENRTLEEKIKEILNNFSKTGTELTIYDSSAFKINTRDSGQNLTISEDGIFAKHNDGPNVYNTVRATMPIPELDFCAKKPSIHFYYEVQFVKKFGDYGICIGFCEKQFPLENKLLGTEPNSIGIRIKSAIRIDGTEINFPNCNKYLNEWDVIGIGILHLSTNSSSSLKCFATWNGELLGMVTIPEKFAHLRLFPAVSLNFGGNSIRANFVKGKWRFEQFSKLLQ